MRDFSTDPKRLAILCGLAAIIGIISAFLAKVLLYLIGLITHLVYFGTLEGGLTQPDPHRLGPVAILIPVIGALLVGLIARYATDKIRGHGIPEAIASILNNDSIVQARVAFWKPIASAITIGTGGPFGAEGPIIMTGGAFGSLLAQYIKLSALERRTLLVAGAAGGMSATFGAPLASVLIAVELLLFEWRPRSFIPVTVASLVAFALRPLLIASIPPFVAAAPDSLALSALPWALALGIAGGAVSMLMTKLVYWTEDAYEKLPIHWMWWPAIGGLIVGIGGWFVPAALGVGYPTINALVNGNLAMSLVIGIIVVKIVIWVASLSSGTSGGVLAPLLMIGAAVGSAAALIIPGHASGAWAIVGMAALMGGTMRSPFMGTLFALETTRAWGLAPEIFVGCVAATAFTVIFVPRSILTEKLARRGMHVAREYAVHPLELIAVSSVMRGATAASSEYRVHENDRVRTAADIMAKQHVRELAVVNDVGTIVGAITADDFLEAWRKGMQSEHARKRVRRLRSGRTNR